MRIHEIPLGTIKTAGIELDDQPKITEAVAWLEANMDAGDAFTLAFDRLISRFNDEWEGNYPSFCTNITALKSIMVEKKLPLLKRIFTTCSRAGTKTRYLTVLHNINQMMKTGDMRKNDQSFSELPYLAYQKSTSDPEDVFVGSLFHFTEEWLILDNVYGLQSRRDLVVNALVEVSALDRSNPLFEAVASPYRLNWIQGYDGFSTGFQAYAGFPPNPALPAS